jgi:hypothetical protein
MMNLNKNFVAVQRVSIFSAFKTEVKPSVTRKKIIGTGFSGSSAWAQPVHSLSDSTGNSQPGPPLPGQECVTGFAGSIGTAAQRESGLLDPTFFFSKTGTGFSGSHAGLIGGLVTWFQPYRA